MPGFEWFGDEERKEVNEVLETGVLFRYGFDPIRKNRWKTKSLEKEIAKSTGAKYCHVCASGTAALSIALASCGIGAGDEVIVPPFTFIATIEAVLHAGAVPVFADIDETLCLSPDSIRASLTPKTRAVLPVHMCGAMARIEEIREICDREGLVLIEDACQALGAHISGQFAGTFGKMGCFSFDPVKTITCGEGGAVITNDELLYKTADAFADHGHDHIGSDRGLEDHPILGYNYRISELNAAVGLAQIRKLDKMIETQKRNKKVIKDALKDIPGVTFRRIPDETGDSATFLSFFLPTEDAARKIAGNLSKAGVDGCFYWFDNNWHYIRKWDHLKQMKTPAGLPASLQENTPDFSSVHLDRSDAIMGKTISMLIKLSWTDADIETRIQAMRTVLAG